MGTHPIYFTLRFLAEIAALIAVGTWAWQQGAGGLRYVFAIGLPLIFASIWGLFAVPGDPSRSGRAPIQTKGSMRMLLEFLFFAAATWAIYDMGYPQISIWFGSVALLHNLLFIARIKWLIRQ